jgi:hypothetical protein
MISLGHLNSTADATLKQRRNCTSLTHQKSSDNVLSLWNLLHYLLRRKRLALNPERSSGLRPTNKKPELSSILNTWRQVYRSLHQAPKMFQMFAFKQVCDVSAVFNNLSKQEKYKHLGKMCPCCTRRMETSGHILFCEEEGRVGRDLGGMTGKKLLEVTHGQWIFRN